VEENIRDPLDPVAGPALTHSLYLLNYLVPDICQMWIAIFRVRGMFIGHSPPLTIVGGGGGSKCLCDLIKYR
jgi:hypothetical protein